MSRPPWGARIAALALGTFLWFGPTLWRPQPIETSYGEFQTLVREGRILQVLLLGDRVHGVLSEPLQPDENAKSSHHVTTRLSVGKRHHLRSLLAEHDIPLTIPATPRAERGPVCTAHQGEIHLRAAGSGQQAAKSTNSCAR